MIIKRAAEERGHANHGWLDAKFTFSFANHYDPKWMGFRALRVINDDRVAAGRGFGMHPHDNMEILTWMLKGSFRHQDTTGGSAAIVPGELQHMSAGSGLMHSEFNASDTDESHSLQIWILPNKQNVKPVYEQQMTPVHEQPNVLHLLASKDGRNGSFVLQADAEMLGATLEAGAKVEHHFLSKYGYLHVAKGEVVANGHTLKGGDGIALTEESVLTIESSTGAEVILFDLD